MSHPLPAGLPDVRLAETQAAFSRLYPFAWPLRAWLSPVNANLGCACDVGASVVYIEFTFADGHLCPNFAPSLYCGGCGELVHRPWRIEPWEKLVAMAAHEAERTVAMAARGAI